MGDQRPAKVELALDLDTRRFERLGIDFGDHELLREVLRADLDLGQRRDGEKQRGNGKPEQTEGENCHERLRLTG